MMTDPAIAAYWQDYLDTLSADAAARSGPFVAEAFGDNPDLADRLSSLVSAELKTATCSALWEWEAEGSPVPQPGLFTVVLDGEGTPVCIIETVEVAIRAFEEVDEAFAYDEGEGDRSLAYWRDAHWRYFSRTLQSIGREPDPGMPLVCERFRKVYPLA